MFNVRLRFIILSIFFPYLCLSQATSKTSNGTVKCWDCKGSAETCFSECSGKSCSFSVQLPLSDTSPLIYKCSNDISTSGCMADPKMQQVTCYCTSNYCNFPLANANNNRLRRMIQKTFEKASRAKRSSSDNGGGYTGDFFSYDYGSFFIIF
jgi:hypothetical protein